MQPRTGAQTAGQQRHLVTIVLCSLRSQGARRVGAAGWQPLQGIERIATLPHAPWETEMCD